MSFLDLYFNEMHPGENRPVSEYLKRLSRMASSLGHEIKNPLTAIDIQLQLLKERIESTVSEENTEKLLRYVRVISREIHRLNGVLDDFLNFSKPAQINYQNCLIREEVCTLIELIEPDASDRGIQVTLDIPDAPLHIECDPDKLRQVLLNIILNSLQAMSDGGHLQIKISYQPVQDAMIIEVSDSGPGIPRTEWERIFEPFYTSKSNGTGLGLAISRRYVQGHGGKVFIARSDDSGTTMQIELPTRRKLPQLIQSSRNIGGESKL